VEPDTERPAPRRALAPTLRATLALLAAALAGACAKERAAQPVIGLITKTETNPFFVKMKEGAQAKADELGVKLLTGAGAKDGDNAGQVTALENMVNAGAKGILITPSDTKAIVPTIQKARDKGVVVIALDTATDWGSFRDALSLFLAPGQNFTYADVDGRIGYQFAGYVPVRSDPADRGDRPVSGSDGTGEWVGRIPFDKLPSRTDPGDGWIVTANNAIVDDGYPGFIGQEWDPGYRAERIIDLVNLAAEDGVTIEDMARIQADTSPLRARDIGMRLEGAEPATEDGRTIAGRIGSWSGDCAVESLGCAAYMTWEYSSCAESSTTTWASSPRTRRKKPKSWRRRTRTSSISSKKASAEKSPPPSSPTSSNPTPSA
jgi:hypothetical protein